MRGLISGTVLAALLATTMATAPALAQDAGRQRVQMAKGSPLAKIFFSEPALVLDDDGTYAGAMQRVGKEVGRDCGAVESFAWDFAGQEREKQQQRITTVYDSTMSALKSAGYSVSERKVRSIPDPETVVYTADGKDKRLVLMWSPVPDAAILLVCDAGKPEPKAAPQTKTAPAKKP